MLSNTLSKSITERICWIWASNPFAEVYTLVAALIREFKPAIVQIGAALLRQWHGIIWH